MIIQPDKTTIHARQDKQEKYPYQTRQLSTPDKQTRKVSSQTIRKKVLSFLQYYLLKANAR